MRAKIVAILMMWASLVFGMTRVPNLALRLLLLAIGIGVSIYLIWFVPVRRPPAAARGADS